MEDQSKPQWQRIKEINWQGHGPGYIEDPNHPEFAGHGLYPGELSQAVLEADRLKNRPGVVFWVSVIFVVAFTAWAALSPESLGGSLTNVMNWVAGSVGWTYLLVSFGCIALMLYLAFSRFGTTRLSASDDERPEFGTFSWLAMILSAVMGIGLISYGVAEPISHFAAPPHGLAETGTYEAAVRAMQFSYFDWGPHAWGVFGVFGLAIAYSTHRRGNTGLVSPMLRPIFGKAADGWLGNVIDIFAVLATLFGTTTSLGLGASQISEGINRVFGIPQTTFVNVIIIGGITVVFTLSALSGVNRGIKILSQSTALLSIFLAIFVLITGPTNFISNLFFSSTGQYLNDFFKVSFWAPLNAEDVQWYQYWTYFMLAWWLSWGAFVGVFLAKISRGRTIREFVLGVMGVPSLVFFIWFTIFGGTAIHIDMNGDGSIGKAALIDPNAAFFDTISHLPWAGLTSVIGIILVILYFISGADANTFVLSMLSSRGTLEPSRSILTVWGALTGIVALFLFLVGGLTALQQTAMISALPFTVIVALLGVSLILQLQEDEKFDKYKTVRREDLMTGALRKVK